MRSLSKFLSLLFLIVTIGFVASCGEEDDDPKDEKPIGAEFVKDGDMSNPDSWNVRQLWNDPDNAVNHDFEDGAFFIDNADGTLYSNYVLWQEIPMLADKPYVFSADIASTSGVNATGSIWLEVYLSNVDPATSGNDYPNTSEKTMRLNFRQECGDGAFNGKLQVLAQACEEVTGTLNMGSNGEFTLAASELTAGGKIFLVFKIGTWDDSENFKAGMTLDNVSIKEVL